MALTQIQIIQSLGEAMSWLERELNWGVPATELRHLTGRIGELYAALITNGQMAPEVNQKGYDVVSGSGEKVSVKTTASMKTGGSTFINPNTLSEVDRLMILRLNTEEMQIEILLNASVEKASKLMSGPNKQGKLFISNSKLLSKPKNLSDIPIKKEVVYGKYTVTELQNGSILVAFLGEMVSPVKPHLRQLAQELNINILNENGSPFNTRQLGTLIIRTVSDE